MAKSNIILYMTTSVKMYVGCRQYSGSMARLCGTLLVSSSTKDQPAEGPEAAAKILSGEGRRRCSVFVHSVQSLGFHPVFVSNRNPLEWRSGFFDVRNGVPVLQSTFAVMPISVTTETPHSVTLNSVHTLGHVKPLSPPNAPHAASSTSRSIHTTPGTRLAQMHDSYIN